MASNVCSSGIMAIEDTTSFFEWKQADSKTIIPNKMIVFHNTTSSILSLISIVALLFHKQRLSHLRRVYGYVRTKVYSGESLCILMNQL